MSLDKDAFQQRFGRDVNGRSAVQSGALESPITMLARLLPFAHNATASQAIQDLRCQLESLNLQQNLSHLVSAVQRRPDALRNHVRVTNSAESPERNGLRSEEKLCIQKPQKRLSRLQHSLQPKGPGSNDCAIHDRTLNILTSIPIIALGAHIRSKGKQKREVGQYGWSVMLVGLAATAYHSSSGKLRTWLRKADYYTISASSALLTKALHNRKLETPPGKLAVGFSLLALPFKPSLVTSCHSAAVEVEYAKQARRHRHLQKHHVMHCASLAAGLSMFGIEDIALSKKIYLTHCLWHCFALNSIASVTPLLLSADRN